MTDQLIKKKMAVTVDNTADGLTISNNLYLDAKIRQERRNSLERVNPPKMPRKVSSDSNFLKPRTCSKHKYEGKSKKRRKSAKQVKRLVKRLSVDNKHFRTAYDKPDFDYYDYLRDDTHNIDKYISLTRTWMKPKNLRKTVSKSTLCNTEILFD